MPSDPPSSPPADVDDLATQPVEAETNAETGASADAQQVSVPEKYLANSPSLNATESEVPSTTREDVAELIATHAAHEEEKRQLLATIRGGLGRIDILIWLMGGLLAFSLVVKALLSPTTDAKSDYTAYLWGLFVGLFFSLVLARVTVYLQHNASVIPKLHLRASSGDARVPVLEQAIDNCESLAHHHNAKSRIYLIGGGTVASVGLILYVVFLVSSIKYQNNSIQVDDLQKLRRAVNEIEAQAKARTLPADSPAVSPSLKETTDLISRIEKVGQELDEKLKVREAEDVAAAKMSFRRDLLPIVRSSIAFVFLEILAGFLLSIAQRNDVQASYWRAHRQTYERMLAAPMLMQHFRQAAGKDDINLDLVKFLLTPVAIPVLSGKESPNPSLDSIAAMADLIQRTKDAAKEIAKDSKA